MSINGNSPNGMTPSPDDGIIIMRNIWKTYQMGTEELHALKDVSFEVRRNEYVAIIGPSGSGKSTLMNLIGCLDSPSKGDYWINGQLVSSLSDDELARIRNKEVGFVFQTFNLLPRATALHNVELPLIYAGLRAGDRHERRKPPSSPSNSANVSCTSRTNSPADSGSVAIARALVNHPSILLADEPTGALDSKTSVEIMTLFEKLHEDGNTIILVTHEPDIAARAHRVITIRDGRIESDERHR